MALNRGRPVYLEEPKADVSRRIATLAESIVTQSAATSPGPDSVFAGPLGDDGDGPRGLFRKR